MAIREGKWKCTYCGEINRGRDLMCTGCGAVREKDVEFFLEDDAQEVTDSALLAAANQGPEWLCEACGTSNPAQRPTCRQCGAPRDSAKYRQVRTLYDEPEPVAPPEEPKSSGWKWGVTGCLGLIGVLVLSFIALVVYLAQTQEVEAQVVAVEWQRTIEVEHLRPVREQAWEDEVPQGARFISASRELHHVEKIQTGTRKVTKTKTERVQVGTKKVKVGVKDKGNGYFEDVYKDEPVYENRQRSYTEDEPIYREEKVFKRKVTYEIDKWVVADTKSASGSDNTPKWPEVATSGKVREGKRTEVYKVSLHVRGSGKTYVYEPSESEFRALMPGSSVKAEVTYGGTVKKAQLL